MTDKRDIDETREQIDDVRNQLDELMDNKMQELESAYKKSMIYSVLWPIFAVIVYFVWPDKWYFWIPAVIAVLTIASFVFVAITRKKLKERELS